MDPAEPTHLLQGEGAVSWGYRLGVGPVTGCGLMGSWTPVQIRIHRRERKMRSRLKTGAQGEGTRCLWGRDSGCSLQAHSWQPGIQNPYRGTVVWMVPENVDVSVTLYRVSLALHREGPGLASTPQATPGSLLGGQSQSESQVRPRIGPALQRGWPGGLLGGGPIDLPRAVGRQLGSGEAGAAQAGLTSTREGPRQTPAEPLAQAPLPARPLPSSP